jgi:iron complex outermembrane receptor protein
MLQINSRSPTFRKQVIAILVSGVFAQLAFANNPEYEAPPLDEIVVSASGYEQKIMDTAASINLVTINQIQNGQARDNLSEPLNRVPGIFALNRQNYAQDLQISSRGFGANSTFGTRGIRLIVDNIPGTIADGQGQISHIDLPSTDRIEVMRGPFSVLYGNSSGGVIRVFTQDGGPKTEVQPYFEVGSYGQRRAGLKASGKSDELGYVIDAGQFHTNGYRDQSAADRRNANAKLSFMGGPDTRITLIANNVSLKAQDPTGLTESQLIANPKQAGTSAVSQNSRKSVDQTQVGASIDFRINANNNFLFSPYLGQRHVLQYLTSATAGSGVIDLVRSFYGMDSKWVHQNKFFDIPMTMVTGIDMNENDDRRRTYTNSGGTAVYSSTASQDYAMSAKNFDQYLQADFRFSERFAFNAGIRNSQTNLSSTTNNSITLNTGSTEFRAMTYMASLQYYLNEMSNVYVSYGSSFDTPTLNQVFYSANGAVNGSSCTSSCSNFGLLAAKTKQVELGFKSRLSPFIKTNIAVFNADTTNDIVIGASNAGRNSFTNAPKTNRQGVEGGAQFKLPYNFETNLAYTWLRATVKESYLTNSTNLSTFNTVASGNRIPGVPNQGLFAELLWVKPNKSVEAAIEARANGAMDANDLNTQYKAPGYAVMNIRGVVRQEIAGGWSFSQFFRLNNVFDRSYVGSVIVNQFFLRSYEPAPTRNWMIGAKASYQFK